MGYFDQEDDIHIPDSNDVNVSSFGSWSTCDCESFYCTFLIVVFGFFHSFRQWNFSVPPHFRSFTYTGRIGWTSVFCLHGGGYCGYA